MDHLEPDDFPANEVVAELYLHIVFSTRKQEMVLTDDILRRLPEEFDQIMFTVDGECLAAGGTANHMHVLARLSPDHPPQKALDAIKQRSAVWVRQQATGPKDFAWQESVVAVGLAYGDLKAGKRFIRDQATHHEMVTFQQETIALLTENGIEYDERELWE